LQQWSYCRLYNPRSFRLSRPSGCPIVKRYRRSRMTQFTGSGGYSTASEKRTWQVRVDASLSRSFLPTNFLLAALATAVSGVPVVALQSSLLTSKNRDGAEPIQVHTPANPVSHVLTLHIVRAEKSQAGRIYRVALVHLCS